RPDGLAGATDDGLGLAGQVGLIESQAVGPYHGAVRDNLVAGGQAHEVSDEHLIDWHAAVDSVAGDNGVGGDQGGKPIERTLGADLLEGPDRDVRYQDSKEERVLPRGEGDREHAKDEQDAVRDVQRVGSDDDRVGAAGG